MIKTFLNEPHVFCISHIILVSLKYAVLSYLMYHYIVVSVDVLTF